MIFSALNRNVPNSRRGLATIAVLALFAIASILFVTWTRDALLRSKSAQKQHERVQAIWLVESGLQRAKAKLRQDDEYRGETWTILADELGQLCDAVVLIQVHPLLDEVGLFTINVQADLPPGEDRHVRQSRTLQFSTNRRGTIR